MAGPAQGALNPVLVVGTGALATLFAARLSGAGHPVWMLGTWQAALAALQREGARLVDSEGRQHSYPVHTVCEPADVRDAHLALVLVKSWQTRQAALRLSSCLADDGLALTLQNGIGNREQLVERLGEGRIVVGTTTTGATLLGPGLVRAGGEGIISLERHPGSVMIRRTLLSAGFKVRLVKDAQSLLWGKLVINAAINPLTALLRVNNGALLVRPAARALMAGLAREAASIAAAKGIQLPFADPVRASEQVARRTAGNRSSMLQDIQRGTPTEIDSICGEIVKQGEKHGIPTPLNQVCWQLVRALASGR